MTIQSIVQRLRKMAGDTSRIECDGCGCEHNCGTHGCAVMREAADKLEELNTFEQTNSCRLMKKLAEEREKHRWIPVTWHKTTPDDGIDAERYPICLDCSMPDEGDEILVTNGIHVWLDVCDFYDGYGLESGNDWIDMTAWMPLPEPYEPEDVEQEV